MRKQFLQPLRKILTSVGWLSRFVGPIKNELKNFCRDEFFFLIIFQRSPRSVWFWVQKYLNQRLRNIPKRNIQNTILPYPRVDIVIKQSQKSGDFFLFRTMLMHRLLKGDLFSEEAGPYTYDIRPLRAHFLQQRKRHIHMWVVLAICIKTRKRGSKQKPAFWKKSLIWCSFQVRSVNICSDIL